MAAKKIAFGTEARSAKKTGLDESFPMRRTLPSPFSKALPSATERLPRVSSLSEGKVAIENSGSRPVFRRSGA